MDLNEGDSLAAIARISAQEAEATQKERKAALADEENSQSFGPDSGITVEEEQLEEDDQVSDEEPEISEE
jgi:hypothetical protein